MPEQSLTVGSSLTRFELWQATATQKTRMTRVGEDDSRTREQRKVERGEMRHKRPLGWRDELVDHAGGFPNLAIPSVPGISRTSGTI